MQSLRVSSISFSTRHRNDDAENGVHIESVQNANEYMHSVCIHFVARVNKYRNPLIQQNVRILFKTLNVYSHSVIRYSVLI